MLRERKLLLLLLAFSVAIFVIYENTFSGNEKQWKPFGLKWIINRDTSSVKQDGKSVEVRSNVSVQTANCIWTNTTTVLRPCFFRTGKEFQNTQRPRLHLATVACGGRWQEGLVLLKSVVALTTTSLVVFHVFTETAQMPHFKKALQDWPEAVLERIEYRLYLATYPPEFKKWKGKFGNCASQRLLFPSLLRDVDAVVYVDADAVLLSTLDKMWNYFSRFNSSQMLALVAEHEDPKMGWYNKKSKIPYFLPLGLNSGVALMNLTRMRQVNFTRAIISYEHTYGSKLAWFDQDLLNIFCRFSPDRFYQMDCSANYRGDHCGARHVHPNSTCKFADKHGVHVLHGSKRHFYSNPTLKAVYQTFRTHDLNSNETAELLNNLTKNLGQAKGKSPCRNVSHIFLKHIQELVSENDVH